MDVWGEKAALGVGTVAHSHPPVGRITLLWRLAVPATTSAAGRAVGVASTRKANPETVPKKLKTLQIEPLIAEETP